MSWDPIAYLKKLHTRQLLKIRDAIHRCHGGRVVQYYQEKGDTRIEHEAGYDLVSNGGSGYWVTLAQVKAELATRPHVPNKKEAKALRRARAQGKA
jgi:hypothetical protein